MRLLDKNGPFRNWLRPRLRRAKVAYRAFLSRRARKRSTARYIGITGSSGKSTTTALLAHMISGRAPAASQLFRNTMGMLTRFLRRDHSGIDYVVVELGAAGPGDIGPMTALLKPHVGIVTLVRLEHYSAFRKIEAVTAEKAALVQGVLPGGLVVLNADDENVRGMAALTGERVVTFGTSPEADYRVFDIHAAYPDTLSFTLRGPAGDLALKTRFPASHFWMPVAAAAATALELGIAPEVVASQAATFAPLIIRGEVMAIPGGPDFILDTAKAPWHSLNLAFDMIGAATAGRKRIVLGHISDYAGSTRKYGNAYQAASEASDEVIFVGDNSHRSRASQEDRDTGRFHEFVSVKPAADHIRHTAVADELILIKGSSNLHLERIALSFTHDVRCWVDACGKQVDCRSCGLFDLPFEEHSTLSRREKRRRLTMDGGPGLDRD